MNILDIITKKKNNEVLTYDELSYAFNGYLNKNIPSYQMSALLMAITINGMTLEETVSLTDIFIRSGEIYDFIANLGDVVDKHSTGGVGDSTTIIVGPICAALGLKMAKMSGRGLGLTGGTIDKLESIPGFNVNLTKEEFYNQVKDINFALSSQTDTLVPLDKVIYALRDVTGTTESLPLIASSIMSKKIASGAKHILIDIKCGSGALLKTREEAEKLSNWLIDIGSAYNRNVRTIISNMDTPLSYAIGNALEVMEAMNILKGKRCPLYNSCVEIAANLLSMVKAISLENAAMEVTRVIDSGEALNKFYDFVSYQGGDLTKLEVSNKVITVRAKKTGTITKIDAHGAAELACKIGASKMALDDKIDYSVGVLLMVKVGDTIQEHKPLMYLYVKNYKEEFTDKDFDFIEIA